MNNGTLYWMTGLVVLGIVILLFLNTLPLIWTPKMEKFLKFNDVKGIAVEHNKKLYTLNFDQQNEVVGFLNKSKPIASTAVPDLKTKLEISKIVIYRFGSPDLTIIPIEYNGNNLIFSAPDWNPEGLMIEKSAGGLKNVLANSYDP